MHFRNFMWILLFFVFAFSGCKTEQLLSDEFDPSVLNGPLGIVIVPGEDIALVTNSNFRLGYETGSLSVIDLITEEIISDATERLPNFSGQVILDATNERVLVPNRLNDSLFVLDYTIPGEGVLPIGFSEPDLANAMLGTTNEIEVEKDPFAALIVEPAGIDSRLYIANIKSGDVSTLNPDDLSVNEIDNGDNESNAIRLLTLSSLSIDAEDYSDGAGPNRMALSTDERFVFLSSSLSNWIFILDSFDDKVEGAIDLTKYAYPFIGTRGLAKSTDDKLFIAHRGLGGVIVLDVSLIADNGINNETIEENYITFIPTGDGPEGLAFDSGETKLYVCNQEGSSVTVIDLASLSVIDEIFTQRGPTEIAVHPTNDKIYVTNFLSNSISVIDTTTDTVTGVIK